MGTVSQIPNLITYQSRFNEAVLRMKQTDIITMICDPVLKEDIWQDVSRNVASMLSNFESKPAQNVLTQFSGPLQRGYRAALEDFKKGNVDHDLIRGHWQSAVQTASTCAAAQAAKEGRTSARQTSPRPKR